MEKLLWVDMEMTGLNPATEVILEVAAIVTDYSFKEFTEFETVIRQPQEYLDRMDDWNQQHHKESGLLAKVPSGMLPVAAEKKILEMIHEHFPNPKSKPILAGNSIAQDRAFIQKHWPTLAESLHYRMLDVTSWKIIFKNKFNLEYKKKGSHRALDDIRESIEELKFYLQYLKVGL